MTVLISLREVTFDATIDAGSITTFASYTGNAGKKSNTAPVANAGPDQDITDNDNDGKEMVVLDGTGSSDSDGNISNYSWSMDGKQVSWQSTLMT